MPLLTFIFGPNNTFFFDSPKSWKFHNIPPTLRQLFNASMNPGWRVQQPYCLALGPPNGSPEPIWYIGCKVCEGTDKIFYSQIYFEINYPDLSRWLRNVPNASRDAFITFGPGFSYFACSPQSTNFAGIPQDMMDLVHSSQVIPNLASLGMGGAWFLMWPDGYYAWKFYGHYSALDKILDAAEPRSIAYLAISPYNKHHFFLVFKDQTVKYSLSNEWMPQMREVFVEWQAEMLHKELARQQQQPHRYSVSSTYRPYSSQHWAPNYPPTPGSPPHLTPATPATPSSIYSQPSFSTYSPYGDPAPPTPSSPMSMNAVLAPTQKLLPRMMSSASAGAIEKKRPWKRKSQAVAPSTGTALTPTVPKVTAEGSQTCIVM